MQYTDLKLDSISIAILFIMLVNSTYGLIIYSQGRNDKANSYFFLLTTTISIWGLSMVAYRAFLHYDMILLMSRLLYFSAVAIPIAFVYFVINFPNKDAELVVPNKYIIFILPISLCILSLYPGGFIHDIVIYHGRETIIIFNKLTHAIFGLYVVTYFIYAYWIIYKKYSLANEYAKKQFIYIVIATLTSTTITLATNLLLLYFGYFELNWVGQIGIIFMITIIFYSIFKFKLFKIRLVAIQIAILLLWLFWLMRLIMIDSIHTFLIESGLFIIILIMSTLLIQNVIRGIAQREEIEDLTEDIKKRYTAMEKPYITL